MTEQEKKSLEKASEILNHVVSIEEKFNLLFENYVEVEGELADAAMRHMFKPSPDHHTFQEDRLKINRRLVNLLTAHRLYTEQLPQHAKIISENNIDVVENIKSRLRIAYDTEKYYRLFDALRNHVQHYDLPLEASLYPTKWVGEEESKAIEHNATYFIDTIALKRNQKFKSSILKEFEGGERYIEIKPVIRKYMQEILLVHAEVQKTLEHFVANSIVEISNKIAEFARLDNSDLENSGLYVVEQVVPTEENNWRSYHLCFPLNMHLIFRVKNLQKSNKNRPNLSKYYISTRSLDYPGAARITQMQ
ncbi:hypothetical protein [Roseomonas mucosa]|uniref:hypothetical protein n=1 Tax=Roseomonas mucosa TaxID=207340 RepID=UPI00223F5145|nr:hypothetical protein [Roseomonas mucosa]